MARAAAHRRHRPAPTTCRRRTAALVRGGRATTGRARRPRASGCCRASCRADAAAQGLRVPAARHRVRHRRERPGAGLRRLRDRPAPPRLRRERVRQDRTCCGCSPSRSPSATRRDEAQDRRRRLPPLAARRRSPTRTCSSTRRCATRMEIHMDALHGLMERRAPAPDVTPQQLRDRSWWSGPQIFVIVDDYDLVATAQRQPAGRADREPALRPRRRHALHHRPQLGGRSRRMYEPFMQRMKELGAQGVVLSGDPARAISRRRPPAPMPPGRGVSSPAAGAAAGADWADAGRPAQVRARSPCNRTTGYDVGTSGRQPSAGSWPRARLSIGFAPRCETVAHRR